MRTKLDDSLDGISKANDDVQVGDLYALTPRKLRGPRGRPTVDRIASIHLSGKTVAAPCKVIVTGVSDRETWIDRDYKRDTRTTRHGAAIEFVVMDGSSRGLKGVVRTTWKDGQTIREELRTLGLRLVARAESKEVEK